MTLLSLLINIMYPYWKRTYPKLLHDCVSSWFSQNC